MPVRDAVASDLEQICSMIEEHAQYEGKNDLSLDREEMAKHLFGPSPKAWVLLATAPGEAERPAGFALCCWNFSTWQAKPGIWLDDIFIRPDSRRHGLGRELLTELRARTEGRVEWEMQSDNEKAAAFYQGLGAVTVDGWVQYRWYPE